MSFLRTIRPGFRPKGRKMGQFLLKALSGELKGESFPVRDRMVIGRRSGDIKLNDPMVSTPHAEILVYEDQKIMIEDLDSKNQILMDGRPVIKSVLEEGSRFFIGRTEFELCYVQSFEEILQAFLKKEGEAVKDEPRLLHPFPFPLELHIVSGLQKGEKFLLSYGPRTLGRSSPDLPLLDKEAPDRAFELYTEPGLSDIFFETNSPEVSFNGQFVEKQALKEGDEIVLGKSRIQVHIKG